MSLHSEEYRGYTIKIHHDDDEPLNPREDYDNLGTMVCFHRRYTLGDKDHGFSNIDDDYSNIDSDYYEKMHSNKVGEFVQLPLYLYDHGGITISTKPFNDPWDSGQVGFIYCTKKRALEWCCGEDDWRQKTIEVLHQEVKEYDLFLTGQTYGYTIENAEGDEVGSCWGFIQEESVDSDDLEKNYVLGQARGEVDSQVKSDQETEMFFEQTFAL